MTWLILRRDVPTYDYQCRSCGTVTEVIHSMLEEGPTTCERCGGELRRVLYPAGIIFKGSGFYATDSRSSSSAGTSATKGAAKGDGGADSGSTPKAAGAEGGAAPSEGGKAATEGGGTASKP